jgi:hypothetical protein
MKVTTMIGSTSSPLGLFCAETLLKRIQQLSITSSNRHILDYLPPEVATALFEALLAKTDRTITVPIPNDAGAEQIAELRALRLERADLVPFLVEDSGGGVPAEPVQNRGCEGFASCLRDYNAIGADRPRYLLTITTQGNETQKSAQDVTGDKILLDLSAVLNTVLDQREVASSSPLRSVAAVYLAFRRRGESWSSIVTRWEKYVNEVASLSDEEQGARLPLLGCFLPDRSTEFASMEKRIRILPASEDQKRRRAGETLSNSRLYDNAMLRGYLDDVFSSSIQDPEQVLAEVFEDAPDKAKAILGGGSIGLDRLDVSTFSGMDQIQVRREKAAFVVESVQVEGAHYWRSFEHPESRFLVVSSSGAVRIRMQLSRPFNPRKEHAQVAAWRGDKNKLEPREVRVAENAQEVVFEIDPSAHSPFAVFRLALTRGPRTMQKPIDALLVAMCRSANPEVLVEEDRHLSLDDQAWVAEEEARFLRYGPDSEPEPVAVRAQDEVVDSPASDEAQVVLVTFDGSDQCAFLVRRRPPPVEEEGETGAFEHEKLLELAAYTVKIGEKTSELFRAGAHYLDAVRHVEDSGNRWRVDFVGGSSRQFFPSRKGGPNHFLYEQAVARLLQSPDTLTLRWSHEDNFQDASTIDGLGEGSERFVAARRTVLDAVRELAIKHVPRFRRNLEDAGVPLWLLPLHHIADQIEAYLDAWTTAVDTAFSSSTQYQVSHDRLLQLDTLLMNEGAALKRLVLLPTNPWLLAALCRYQGILAQNFRVKGKRRPLQREEVEQLVPRTALEDWYISQEGGARLLLTDSAPFHMEFLPEEFHKNHGTLDYVERIVANKIERYLRMHPHLRDGRRALRIGFINPGDGKHLLNGIHQWLFNLMRERSGRIRLLPHDEIPSIDVFLFTTRGEDTEVGSAFEEFFRQSVAASDEDVIQQALVSRVRYRRSSERGPTSPADAVHICFVHSLVDARNKSNRTGQLDEWWDGGFGDGLLTTYLRRALPGASGQLHSRRGLWLDPNSAGLRGALARLLALQRGCRDSDLQQNRAIYWECPLPDVRTLGHVYKHSDWVVHLDRELSLELFTRGERRHNHPMIIEYSDQEVPESPGYDTITVTRYADPYREQLGEILTTVALDMHGRGDAARDAAYEILGDINVLSGSWALDFLLGSIAGKRYSLRLKGNIGAALVYRWLKRNEGIGSILETNVGNVVPVLISLEDLLRVTPAAGRTQKEGLVRRYTNEDDKDPTSAKFCDDLLVLYVTPSQAGVRSRIYGRIIEVKFGTTALAAEQKAIIQVRNTYELLQQHMGGGSEATVVEAPFRHKQLSLLLKAQLEQAVAMEVLSPDVYAFLNIPVLSANLATGNYDVDYTLGIDDQHILGDAFLLNTRDEPSTQLTSRLENGVRVITLPRTLVEWLTFELHHSPTLRESPTSTQPRLGRFQNVRTQPGNGRRNLGSPSRTSGEQSRPAEEAEDRTATAAAATTSVATHEGETAAATLANVPEPARRDASSGSERSEQVAPVVAVSPVSTREPLPSEAVEPSARIGLEELSRAPVKEAPYEDSAVIEVVGRLERALRGHKIGLASSPSARETDRGPRLLRVHVRLEAGESINSLRRVSEDLARDVGTESSDIHISNVPERHAVGMDLPIRGLTYGVSYAELVAHPSFVAAQEELSLGFCAGIDITGRAVWTDLAQMPHALVAGTTGSGKTVFLRNIILTLLMHHPPERMNLRLSSSKPMDFRIFTQVPHMAGCPMATDPAGASHTAQVLVEEMDRRITLISDAFCDNLAEFNRENPGQALPYIVAVFDEYAEMVASFGDRQERIDFESAIGRLAQKARAAGIHLIICMQRPDANALKGGIKANILHRFALKLPQNHDSQVILDESGAEMLLGHGDLLYKDASNRMYRLQVPSLDNAYLKESLRAMAAGGTPSGLDLDSSRTCPKCGSNGKIKDLFGTRKMRYSRRDGSEAVTERPQSYCRNCRVSGGP